MVLQFGTVEVAVQPHQRVMVGAGEEQGGAREKTSRTAQCRPSLIVHCLRLGFPAGGNLQDLAEGREQQCRLAQGNVRLAGRPGVVQQCVVKRLAGMAPMTLSGNSWRARRTRFRSMRF